MNELEALFTLQEGLPRNGPGSDALTLRALERLGRLPAAPRVLDLGCGRGRATRVLARALGPAARIVAVDRHAPFLDLLARDLAAEGLGSSVELRCTGMEAPGERPGTVDLLWSEGAAYTLGFEAALRAWRPLLAAQGWAAVSECTWLKTNRPEAATALFGEAYPAMGTLADNLGRVQRACYVPIETIVFPPSAWWDEYYRPLQARIAALRKAPMEPALAAACADAEREIAVFEHSEGSYSYVFYLLAAG